MRINELDRLRHEIKQIPAAERLLEAVTSKQHEEAPPESLLIYGEKPEHVEAVRRLIGIPIDELKPLFSEWGDAVTNRALTFVQAHELVELKAKQDGEKMHPLIGVSTVGRELLLAIQKGEHQGSLGPKVPDARPRLQSRDIFVVHGRNLRARDAIFAFLRAIDLRPLEWGEALGVTDRASPYVGEVLDAAFDRVQAVVVLLTGDDEARLAAEFRSANDPRSESQLLRQPRPNVLFEAGMALARHPEKTVLVQFGDIRGFSDIAGRHIVRIVNGSPSERHDLASRLRRAGCPAQTEGRTDWLTFDFFSGIIKPSSVPGSAA